MYLEISRGAFVEAALPFFVTSAATIRKDRITCTVCHIGKRLQSPRRSGLLEHYDIVITICTDVWNREGKMFRSLADGVDCRCKSALVWGLERKGSSTRMFRQ